MTISFNRLKQNRILLLIFVLALVLRLIFLSSWLEDWDSVSFAKALHEYSLVNHFPHPPGYPLYILLGKIFYIVLKDDTKALTIMSAILGAASIIPLFLLAQKMFNRKIGFLAVLLFTVSPIQWGLSEVALTNVPALFFFLIWSYFLYTCQTKKHLAYLSLGAGLMLGFRFTELPIIASLLGLIIIRRQFFRHWLLFTCFFILGILIWVLPLLLVTGVEQFIPTYSWIALYVLNHDFGLAHSVSLTSFFTFRLNSLWYLLKIGLTPYFILLGLVVIVFITLTKEFRKQFNYQFLMTWLIAYALPLIFIYNLEVPRYTLPLLPPLVLFICWVFWNKKLFLLLFFVALAMFQQGLSQVSRFKYTLPPVIASVQFVKNNFKPENTIIIATLTYRQFQYYAPEFKTISENQLNQTNLPLDKTVILDYLGLKKNSILGDLTISSQKQFKGDPDIFPRISEVNLYILNQTK